MEKIFELDDFDAEKQSNGGNYENWKRGLISDYVLTKSNAEDELPPLLSKLAELALMRSVVDGLADTKPKQKNRSTLITLFDAPLALYAMGASGTKQKAALQSTMDAAKSIGVRFGILPISVEEIKRVLSGVLYTDRSDRRAMPESW